MALRRSSLLLLGALIALFALPASALAQAFAPNTPLPPNSGWVKSGHTVTWPAEYAAGSPIEEVEWSVNGAPALTGEHDSIVQITGATGANVTLTTRVQVAGVWSTDRTDTYHIDNAPPADNTSTDPVWMDGPA